jgi:hypothetical protein
MNISEEGTTRVGADASSENAHIGQQGAILTSQLRTRIVNNTD